MEFVFPVKEQESSILEQYNEVNWTFIGSQNRRNKNLKFENTEVWGFEHALRGMRNPKNSWDRSDSFNCLDKEGEHCSKFCKNYNTEKCFMYGNYRLKTPFVIGDNDMKLAQNLIKAGGEHSKFMRMIHVSVDVDMPRYWWSEADTYHFNTKNSCSTMHKLLDNDNLITKDLFVWCEEDEDIVGAVVNRLESLRQEYKNPTYSTDKNRLLVRAKRLLMEGFLQMRTWDTNYAELRNMYFQRRHHRLKEEWVDIFCRWVESLPYAEELIMYEG